jgi:hypothetical protein
MPDNTTISVAVVCMTSAQHLRACLRALASQRGAPAFDVTVVCDPAVSGLEALEQEFPAVRVSVNAGQRSPLTLVSRALAQCRGDLVLLTKDFCAPDADWVRAMAEAQGEGRAAVGGRVECAPAASATDWAFYFIDLYRYAGPVTAGETPTLTVCNVSYRRRQLEQIREVWQEAFVETAVNGALRARFGALWMHPASGVTMHRHLTLRQAVVERYAFGRLFGYSRLAASGRGRRLALACLAPAIPLLLLARTAGKASRSRRLGVAFLRSLVPLSLMILARFWGEWLAYLSGRPPRGETLAEAARHGHVGR